MLYQANMPNSFWAEAMSTAAYVNNRLPSESIDFDIPYERWFNKPLDNDELKLLKPFGCIVDIGIPEQRRKQQKRNKFNDRSTRACFVGYHSSTSYKVWEFERKCFVVAHDWRFHETNFPNASEFDDPPAYDSESIAQSPSPTSSPSSSRSPSPSPPPIPRPIYDSIEVLPPPALQVYASYLPEFQPNDDPASFTDAMRRPDADYWWKAFCNEIQAIIDNNTWTLTDLPPGKKVIPTRWVCRQKVDAKNKFEKYKARFVAKGYSQEAGINYDKTFAPVVRIESVRTIFAIAAAYDLFLLHVDCQNAFLNGESDVELYVVQPEGFVDPRYPDKVLRLNKSLYGLKQASRI
jgi:Reverse transcriptase (RNA-dependent DNA polymerase)